MSKTKTIQSCYHALRRAQEALRLDPHCDDAFNDLSLKREALQDALERRHGNRTLGWDERKPGSLRLRRRFHVAPRGAGKRVSGPFGGHQPKEGAGERRRVGDEFVYLKPGEAKQVDCRRDKEANRWDPAARWALNESLEDRHENWGPSIIDEAEEEVEDSPVTAGSFSATSDTIAERGAEPSLPDPRRLEDASLRPKPEPEPLVNDSPGLNYYVAMARSSSAMGSSRPVSARAKLLRRLGQTG